MSRKLFEEKALSRQDLIYNDLLNLAINRFNWSNLPYGLNTETLERLIINYGQVMCFNDKNNGLLILPCMPSSDLNIYGIATDYTVISVNGKYQDTISIDDGILIKNNPLATADKFTLEIFAKRIDDVEMTQEVNLFQQCVPKVLLADENTKLTAKNLFEKVKEFNFAIFAKKSLASNISTSDVLDTSSPFLLDKLQDYKNTLRNEVLTFLGINNANTDKKERLIRDEVNSNNDFVQINIDLMYDLRKKACDDINSKFGTNISVEKREVESGEIYSNSRGNYRE